MITGTPFEVSKEVFERAKANCTLENKGEKKWFYMTAEDKRELFTDSVLYGYGLYGCIVRKEEDGKYMCHYEVGDSCD